MRSLRMLLLLGMGVFGALLVFLGWNSDTGYAYRMHYRTQALLALDFADLKVMPSTEVVRSYPVGMYCRPERTELGDSFCATELSGWNSVEALDTVFFFEAGQLAYAKVDVPPWAHRDLLAYVNRHYGDPVGYTSRMQWGEFLLAGAANAAAASVRAPLHFDMSPDELGVWMLPTGACLVVNMKADWPLQWSTAFWMSPAKPCITQKQE